MNRLIHGVLSNRLLIMVLAVLVMAAGWGSYRQLPVDAFPDVSPNLVQVFTVTEGLAPEEIEKYVTFPVEVAMNGLPGITEIRSVSNFGLSVVNVYFEDDIDIYFARQVVGERLQEAREQIPEGFGDPEMGPISTGMGLILFYYIEDTTGRYTLEELRTIQDWIVKFQLQTVPGVTEVLGIGGWEKQFHVEVDPMALLRYDVSLTAVINAIHANNLNVGAQFLERNSEEIVVRSVGLATGIPDLKRVVIKTVDGTPVFLADLAEIRIGGAIRRGLQTHNGVEEVVAGQVVKLFGTNSSTVIGAVEEKLEEVNDILPEGVRIVPYYQQKALVEAAVRTVTTALLVGIALVALVLLIFMGGMRASAVVAFSIPFSVLAAFIGMHLIGLSANLMSFGGLAIAIGMMVDGTIVMVENIDRMLRKAKKGESRLEIIARAGSEVARPILFAISIIVIVFLPLFTLQGVEGKTFRPLAYTVAMAMFGSLIYALLVSPVMAWMLMRRPKIGHTSFSDRVVAALNRPYEPLVRFFVRHRGVAVTLACVLLAVGVLILPQLGSEF
ncbi:MAG: CusA/CzcA family heavy metal efflux RND transporter, partial [Acidobacteria bacterium]